MSICIFFNPYRWYGLLYFYSHIVNIVFKLSIANFLVVWRCVGFWVVTAKWLWARLCVIAGENELLYASLCVNECYQIILNHWEFMLWDKWSVEIVVNSSSAGVVSASTESNLDLSLQYESESLHLGWCWKI